MTEETTYGKRPEGLSRLLAIALERDDTEPEVFSVGGCAEVLRTMLASCPPLGSASPDSMYAILNRPCDEMLAVARRTMAELLLAYETDVAIIKTLKDYAKELIRQGPSEAKQAAATAMYYAAIASALVFHTQKITNLSYHKLEKAYTDLEKERWAPSELKDLFSRARAVCQQREPKPEQNQAP